MLHQEQSNPGHVGQWFRRNGHALDIRKPRYGDPLPETLEHHCGAVIFGGPMSANDKDEFIRRETEWIGVALKEEKPFLGICLGAQMLANHLGAKVGFHADELAEIGYYPLLTTPDGTRPGALPRARLPVASRGLRAGARRAAACHIHRRLPQPGLRLRLGGIGVQFHPEITYAQVHRWTGHNNTRLGMKGARERHEHIEGHIHHGPKVHAWLDRFLGRWIEAELTIDWELVCGLVTPCAPYRHEAPGPCCAYPVLTVWPGCVTCPAAPTTTPAVDSARRLRGRCGLPTRSRDPPQREWAPGRGRSVQAPGNDPVDRRWHAIHPDRYDNGSSLPAPSRVS